MNQLAPQKSLGSSTKMAKAHLGKRMKPRKARSSTGLMISALLVGAGLIAAYFYIKGRNAVAMAKENLESEMNSDSDFDFALVTIQEIDPQLQARLDAQAAFDGLIEE